MACADCRRWPSTRYIYVCVCVYIYIYIYIYYRSQRVQRCGDSTEGRITAAQLKVVCICLCADMPVCICMCMSVCVCWSRVWTRSGGREAGSPSSLQQLASVQLATTFECGSTCLWTEKWGPSPSLAAAGKCATCHDV